MIYLLSPASKENDACIPLPMIRFHTFKKEIVFEKYDMLMFTSKQAVLSTQEINSHWKNTPCIAIGKATAKLIKDLGGTVAYIPKNFYAKTLTEDIVRKFKNKKILYLRPKVVSFDSKRFLASQHIVLDEEVIYETVCIHYTQKDRPQKNAIIIFTSPSTIDCFFKNFTWDESYHAVVIGEVTKKHLPKSVSVSVADEPLITACIKKAKSIIKA